MMPAEIPVWGRTLEFVAGFRGFGNCGERQNAGWGMPLSRDTHPVLRLRRPVMNLRIEYEQETDGRWLAEVPQLPGVLRYGRTADDATSMVEVLALRTKA